MKKDVIISISGLQFELDRNEAVEVISPGEYYYRNGKHYILYDEIDSDFDGENNISKNTIKITDHHLEIIKDGVSKVHMVFEMGKKNMTYYNTPMGNLLIGLDTTKFQLTQQENELGLQMEYGLDVNYAFVSDCSIEIKVKEKGIPDGITYG